MEELYTRFPAEQLYDDLNNKPLYKSEAPLVATVQERLADLVPHGVRAVIAGVTPSYYDDNSTHPTRAWRDYLDASGASIPDERLDDVPGMRRMDRMALAAAESLIDDGRENDHGMCITPNAVFRVRFEDGNMTFEGVAAVALAGDDFAHFSVPQSVQVGLRAMAARLDLKDGWAAIIHPQKSALNDMTAHERIVLAERLRDLGPEGDAFLDSVLMVNDRLILQRIGEHLVVLRDDGDYVILVAFIRGI